MKTFFCTLLLFTGIFLNAQKKSFLPGCKDAEFPKACSLEKLKAEVGGLVTKEMHESMKASGKEHFLVETIFIVDEKGKVIPAETRFLTEIEALKKPLENYVASLPVFIPKGSSEKERRDVYIVILDYLLDKDGQDYHIAAEGEVNEKHIQPTHIKLDEYPTYPGCEGIYDSDQKCMMANMYKKIINKFRIPSKAPNGQVKMIVTFIITEEGELEVYAIKGGSEDFQKEIKRVLGKLPKMSPAKISGIPIRISFNLPVTVNVS